MSLFFKHLIRSVKKRPTQPLILIFTMAVAVAVCILSLTLRGSLVDEERLAAKEEYGAADITVSLNGKSKTRFIFADEIEELIGDGAKCAGYYEIIASPDMKETVLIGAAVDFESIGDIFELNFSEYAGVSESTAQSSVFITRALASELGISAGDGLTLRIFNKDKSFTVAGISEKPFMKSYDVMVDITGIMHLLAGDSVFGSVMGDDFKPSSRVFIDLTDGADVEEALAVLKSSPELADKSIEAAVSAKGGSSSSEIYAISLNLAVVLICLIAAVVCFSSFYILSMERSEENGVFVVAGAKPSLMNFMQYAEILIYWLLGGAFGIGALVPLLPLAEKYIGFAFAGLDLTLRYAALGALIMLAVALLTASAFILFGKKSPRAQRGGIGLLVLLFVLSVVGYAFTYSLSGKWCLTVGFATAITVFLFAFFSAKPILRFAASLACRFAQRSLFKGRRSLSSFYYSMKNLYSVDALHNVSRLISLSVAVCVCVFFAVGNGKGNIIASRAMFTDEYVIVNGTSRCAERVAMSESVESVGRAYMSMDPLDNDCITNMISVSDLSLLTEELGISALPTGNEAVISDGQAKMLSLNVGDSFTVEGMELEVIEIINCVISVTVFDCEHFGIDYDLVIPRAKAGISDSELLRQLNLACADDVASIVSTSGLMDARLRVIGTFLRSADLLLPAALAVIAVGIPDTLAESYRKRREELELFRVAGMSRGEVARMKRLELVFSTAFGVLFGGVVFAAVIPAIRQAMLSFGSDIIDGFLQYVK